MLVESTLLAWAAIPGIIAGVAAATSAGVSISQAVKKPPTGPDPQKLIQKRTNAAAAITSGGLRSTLLTPAAGLQGSAPVQRATLLGQ